MIEFRWASVSFLSFELKTYIILIESWTEHRERIDLADLSASPGWFWFDLAGLSASPGWLV